MIRHKLCGVGAAMITPFTPEGKVDYQALACMIDYVIEGTLTITIDGKTYTAHAGDVLFVPANSKVVWGSPDRARVFYATYPANWADLL